ncbi:hypothetical protein [Rhodococcus sp. B10]|uniref:hypothetical protein n=1 Tax=Rhodococcus sp. B10 TaxID=2695876 RepID=UPI0014318493|nr:hypothetical protein [Rhodococcus sp. B10]NIL77672.1 hypothetical protein [Rhodococcus sp. B10]
MTASITHLPVRVVCMPAPRRVDGGEVAAVVAECAELLAKISARKADLDDYVTDFRTAETPSERSAARRLYESTSSLIDIETGFLQERLDILKEITK